MSRRIVSAPVVKSWSQIPKYVYPDESRDPNTSACRCDVTTTLLVPVTPAIGTVVTAPDRRLRIASPESGVATMTLSPPGIISIPNEP
jgi:hypothetical protein